MPTGKLSIGCEIGGETFQQNISKTADHVNNYTGITLTAGKAGTLTTRSNDTVGEMTLGGGHGITDGTLIDVFWTGGLRYGVVVGTVATNVVPISGGTGDALVAQNGTLIATPQITVNATIDGDEIEILAMNASARAHVQFQDAANDTIGAMELTANEPYAWHSSSEFTNPLTGDVVTQAKVANGTATAATLDILSLVDSTV